MILAFNAFEFTLGIIFGSFIACSLFVGRLVYVINRAKWRKSVETPQVPDRFRQRTVSNTLHARPTVEEAQQLPPRQGTARVRPIRRVR